MTQAVTRTHRPQKVAAVQRLVEVAQSVPVICVSRLHKVRAAQLMALRKNFRGQLTILVAKNTLAKRAFQQAGLKEIAPFLDGLAGQNAFIFTTLSPFKLYLILERSRVSLPARAGDVVTEPVVIPAGNTGIAPGPVLSDFKEAKIPTRIDTGSIWVTKDTVVAQPGDVVDAKLAGLLARLGLKPIRAGLSIHLAYFDGLILHAEDIRLDLNAYREEIRRAVQAVHAVSVSTGYLTKETAPLVLAHAYWQARAVARESGYTSADTVVDVFATAQSRAQLLYALVRRKAYS